MRSPPLVEVNVDADERLPGAKSNGIDSIGIVHLVLACVPFSGRCSQPGGRASSIPNTDEIVAQLTAMNAERAARLRSYSGLRLYELDYKGSPTTKHAKMTVHVRYETPNIEFEVISMEGSKLLLNRVLWSAKTSCSRRNARGSVQMARIFLSCVQQLKCLCEAEWACSRPT
jgi:hypothetical protein